MSYAPIYNEDLLGEEVSNEEISVEESQPINRSAYSTHKCSNHRNHN